MALARGRLLTPSYLPRCRVGPGRAGLLALACGLLAGGALPARAWAEDGAGPERSSSPAAADRPAIRFSAPVNGQYVGGVVRLLAEVTYSRRVDHVGFYRDNTLLGVDFDAPYEWAWDTRPGRDGPAALEARAVDADFHEGVTPSTVVTVDNTLPEVRLLQPEERAVVVGDVPLAAEARDAGGVQLVRFLANGRPIGESTHAPYQATWASQDLPNGRYAVQARAVDLAGNGANTEPVHVRIANFNRAPVLEPVGAQRLEEGKEFRLALKAADLDGPRDLLTFQAANLPPWLTLDASTGELRGTPPATEVASRNASKTYPGVQLQACDPEPLCDTEEISLTVTDTNRPPEVTVPTEVSVKEGETLVIAVKGRDPDGEPVTCAARGLPDWAAFNVSSCTLRGVPGHDVASQKEPLMPVPAVTFQICDPKPLCTGVPVQITVADVNLGPMWQDLPPTLTADEGRPIDLYFDAVDPDGDRLRLEAKRLPDGAKFEQGAGKSSALFSWEPRGDQSGTHEMTVIASDGQLEASAIVTVVVRERSRSISGTVVDNRDRPVRNLIVQLIRGGTVETEAKTDTAGFYLFKDLQADNYMVRPELNSLPTTGGVGTVRVLSVTPQVYRMDLRKGDQRGLDFVVESKQ